MDPIPNETSLQAATQQTFIFPAFRRFVEMLKSSSQGMKITAGGTEAGETR